MYLSDTLAYRVQIGWTYIQMFLRQFQFSLDSLSIGAVLLPCLVSPLLHSQNCLDLNDKLNDQSPLEEVTGGLRLPHTHAWIAGHLAGGVVESIYGGQRSSQKGDCLVLGQGPRCRGHQEMLRRLVLTPARASPPNGTAQSYYFPIRKLDSLRV